MRDLHLHLSGAVDPVVLYEVVKRQGFKVKAKSFWEFHDSLMIAHDKTKDLKGYLDVLHFIDRAQSNPEMVELSVYNAFVSSYLSGCTHLDLRFNPTKRSQNGAIDLDSIIISARSGMERARSVFGIDGSLILCLGRDCTAEANEAVAKKAKQYIGKGISGIDIAGPYSGPPGDLPHNMHMNYFHQQYSARALDTCLLEAQDAGLLTTVHVGETYHSGTYHELKYVLDVLKPNRIGHGIQIVKSEELMGRARELGVEFEVCISSNLATGAVGSLEEMKAVLKGMGDYKLTYHICTDSTHLLGTNITKENQIHAGLWDH